MTRRRAAPEPDLIDRRQRLAAAILLAAVDLPAPMDRLGKLWLQAARVAPGCEVEDVCRSTRLESLRAARAMIDAMIYDVVPLEARFEADVIERLAKGLARVVAKQVVEIIGVYGETEEDKGGAVDEAARDTWQQFSREAGQLLTEAFDGDVAMVYLNCHRPEDLAEFRDAWCAATLHGRPVRFVPITPAECESRGIAWNPAWDGDVNPVGAMVDALESIRSGPTLQGDKGWITWARDKADEALRTYRGAQASTESPST